MTTRERGDEAPPPWPPLTLLRGGDRRTNFAIRISISPRDLAARIARTCEARAQRDVCDRTNRQRYDTFDLLTPLTICNQELLEQSTEGVLCES